MNSVVVDGCCVIMSHGVCIVMFCINCPAATAKFSSTWIIMVDWITLFHILIYHCLSGCVPIMQATNVDILTHLCTEQ